MNESCHLRILDHNVWEFTFDEPSHKAIDEWFDHQEKLLQHYSPDQIGVVRMLLIAQTSNIPPIRYSFQRAATFRRQHPEVERLPLRAALVTPMGFSSTSHGLAMMLQTGIHAFTLRRVQIRLFTNDRSAALGWLLSSG
jgi:hypothetical protein